MAGYLLFVILSHTLKHDLTSVNKECLRQVNTRSMYLVQEYTIICKRLFNWIFDHRFEV